MPFHKDKSTAAAIALFAGGLGAHRFFLRGPLDRLGLLHLTSIPISGIIIGVAPDANVFYKLLPLLISVLAGCLAALVIGLTSDEKWDRTFNPESGRSTNSRWPLAIVLVLTMLFGFTLLIGTISRLFDLMYTGGAYG